MNTERHVSCAGDRVVGDFPISGVLEYNITPLSRVVHWSYTAMTVLLCTACGDSVCGGFEMRFVFFFLEKIFSLFTQ